MKKLPKLLKLQTKAIQLLRPIALGSPTGRVKEKAVSELIESGS